MNYNVRKKANGVNGLSALRGRGTAPGRGRVPTGQRLPRPSASETPQKDKDKDSHMERGHVEWEEPGDSGGHEEEKDRCHVCPGGEMEGGES